MKYINFLLSLSLLMLFSCKEDLTASWLKIDSITLNTNVTTQGENSHEITDAWVYMDNQPLGVWELPCELPILDEGTHKFTIFPGIKSNGINETRIRYPFYTSAETELTLVKGETVTYNPTVTYKPNVGFIGREDFEDTGTILNPDLEKDTTKISIITKNNYPDIVKYGNNCGRIYIDKVDSALQVYTDLTIQLDPGKIFLEVDYMNTNSFAVGFVTQSSTQYKVDSPYGGAFGQDLDEMRWKKIYFDLSEYISYTPNLQYFEYYIVSSLDEGNTEGVVYLDNLKIVHFN